MSFPAKPNPSAESNKIPTGVKIANTIFVQNQGAYNIPQIQQQASAYSKGKPRGGWDEEDDGASVLGTKKSAAFVGSQTNPIKPNLNVNTTNKPLQQSLKPNEKQESSKKLEVLNCDDQFFNTHSYENKLITELIQPSGARLRHSDAVLNEFCKACESLQVEIIGSLLIYNLNAPIVWASKAKNIFAIEALVKKIKKYYEYFHCNLKALKGHEFVEEGTNAPQLKKFLNDLVAYIEEPDKLKTPVMSNSATIISTNMFNQQGKSTIHTQSPGVQSPTKSEESTPQNSTVPKQNPQAKNNLQTQNKSQSLPQSPADNNGLVGLTNQLQTQPKPNPFGIAPSNSGSQSANLKPPSGLPGNFKNKVNKSEPCPNQGATIQPTQTENLFKPSTQPDKQIAKDDKANDIMDSLAGLNFGGNGGDPQGINGIYNAYNSSYQYNTQNFGPMPYPPVHDPNMVGFPGIGQYVHPDPAFYNYPYPPAQFYPQFIPQTHDPHYTQINPPQFNPQMHGQLSLQYNTFPNHSVQGHPQQVDQSAQIDQGSNVQGSAQSVKSQEKKVSPEELLRRKQQEENEKKFDNLKFLL